MPKKISNKLYDEIKKYVDDRYEIFKVLQSIEEEMNFEDGDIHDENFIPKFILERIGKVVEDLEEKLENSFSEELISIIEKRNLKAADVYRKANIDRKHFSKIKNNPDYQPSKVTAIAFALALELDIEETNDFIGKAGYILTHSSRFDTIIEYCIEHKIYNITDINDILYDFGENLIGC